MKTHISQSDLELIRKWTERKRVATVPVCSECQRECETVTEDHGGMEEVWGAMIWHTQLVDVSECCGEGVDYLTKEEYDALEEV
jgi:hypothetical protein